MTQLLTDVSGVGPSMAETLKKHNVTSVGKLASIELQKLTEIPGIGEVTGKAMIESAEKLVDSKQQPAGETAMTAGKKQVAPAENPVKEAKKDKKDKKNKKGKKNKKSKKDKKSKKSKK